jgi:hypothetical protein
MLLRYTHLNTDLTYQRALVLSTSESIDLTSTIEIHAVERWSLNGGPANMC